MNEPFICFVIVICNSNCFVIFGGYLKKIDFIPYERKRIRKLGYLDVLNALHDKGCKIEFIDLSTYLSR